MALFSTALKTELIQGFLWQPMGIGKLVNRTSVVILAAESGIKHERWANAETPKQLINVQGETLLKRTLRLLQERGVCYPWLLTTSEVLARHAVRAWCPLERDTKAHSLLCANAVSDQGDLLVLYSDVYYSEAAITTILEGEGTHFYGRDGRSAYTFKNYGELFAARIAAADRKRARMALETATEIHARTGDQSFWTFYRLMAGLPVEDRKAIERRYFVDLHDETDDIDFAHEVPMLLDAINKPIRWRVRHVLRRLSLMNKRRRDQSRKSSSSKP